MKTFLCTFFCFLLASSLMAVTVTWNGGAGDWNDPSKWSTGSIPNSGDEVDIPNGKVYIPGTYYARAITLTIGASARLVVDGTLDLQNGTDVNAIVNDGFITNSGRINISHYDWVSLSSTGHGILNNNYFLNRQDGLLIISDVEGSAIKNEAAARFYNFNDLVISNVSASAGIENKNIFLNAETLTISAIRQQGIYNRSTGNFENRGSLTISITGGAGIHNVGSYQNKPFCTINIQETGGDGVFNEPGNGFFINEGTLEISNDIEGIGILSGSSFTNTAGASIEIQNTATSGVHNTAIFNQEGDLIITNINRGIVNAHSFSNTGRIAIGQTDESGLYNQSGHFTNNGLFNIDDVLSGAAIVLYDDTISNAAQGVINIHTGIVAGIQMLQFNSNAQILNYGAINISDTQGDGIICSAKLLNYSSGEITITNSDRTGLGITAYGEFNNAGSLEINQTYYSCLLVQEGFFVNENGGSIRLSDTNSHGMEVRPEGEFINEGATLDIQSPIGIYGLNNQGIIQNVHCAAINMEGILSNSGSAYFYNSAWFNTNYAGNHLNSATFINEGGIGDHNGAFSSTAIQNNSILSSPLSGSLQVGVPYPNVLEVGTPNFIKVLGFFTDSNLTTSAGDYESSNNTFTPNNNAVGASELFVHLFHNDDKCDYIFPVRINGTIVPLIAPTPSSLDIAEEQAPSVLTIFPNPSSGRIQIKTGEIMEGNYQLQLFDAHGKRQFEQQISITSDELHPMELPAHLPPALYLIKIGNQKGAIFNQRIIIR